MIRATGTYTAPGLALSRGTDDASITAKTGH
jgi:hypothetical protein